VQKAMMLAVQFAIGMTDDQATGVFGPATQAGLRANTVGVGSTGRWVQLFSAALVFNQRDGATFTDTFTVSLAGITNQFQEFTKLPRTGQGDFQTWASLLVSTGDSTRRGTAVDCVTEITDARAASLKAQGYAIVGRYLCNVPGTRLDKELKFGELDTIAANGLRCFPIYQTFGDSASYFQRAQGAADAFDALDRLRFYGFKAGTRVYFAVDFDAVDSEVTDRVIPHFQGIKAVLDEYGSEYSMGIYGPRNICSRVGAAGLTSSSFVSDMSTGYSGNLGYPLPRDWAFDQISTISIGSGDGAIEIDNDIVSGRDIGQGSFGPGRLVFHQDVAFDPAQRPALLAALQHRLEADGIPERGGNPVEDAAQFYSTTEAFNAMIGYDALFTNLARTLQIRKALVMTVIMWEIRKYALDDPIFDDGVRLYHSGQDYDPTDFFIRRDCSTGLGQILAETAIKAHNYMVGMALIDGEFLDADDDATLFDVWQKLNGDNAYNIRAAAQVLMEASNDIGIRRPSLDYTDEESRLVLMRYQGYYDPNDPDNNAKIEADSRRKLGMYQVMEQFFAPLRD
jgi:peptidoglycan hydrolase-like protein with peptidoglycan-binding domain